MSKMTPELRLVRDLTVLLAKHQLSSVNASLFDGVVVVDMTTNDGRRSTTTGRTLTIAPSGDRKERFEHVKRQLARGIQKKIIAAELGMSQPTFSNWMRGVKTEARDHLRTFREINDVNREAIVQAMVDCLYSGRRFFVYSDNLPDNDEREALWNRARALYTDECRRHRVTGP
jgi:DNA-binding NarL/FixJ family response regulator